jgi:hypothetical protein
MFKLYEKGGIFQTMTHPLFSNMEQPAADQAALDFSGTMEGSGKFC